MKKKSKFKLALEELEHELQRTENDSLFDVVGGYQILALQKCTGT